MIKTVIFSVLLLLGMITGAKAGEQVEISRFQGEKITGIDVSGAFEIKIRQGEETGVVLSIPARYKNQLTVSLDGNGKLKIGFKGTIKGERGDRYLAEIVCSSLEYIDLSGACRLSGEGDFYGEKLSIDLSGAATVTMGGYVEVGGKVEADLSGAARFTGKLSAPFIDAELSGAAYFTLSGNADSGKLETSGAAQAHMGDFTFRTLSASASGASSIKVCANEQLSVSGSGAAKLFYRSEGRVNVHTSGASTISQF